jgi:hypothetical protein
VFKALLFLHLLSTVQSTSEETSVSVNDFEEEGEEPIEAVFITQPKQEMVNAGGEFRLPCFLETMSDYVLVWKFSGSGQTDTILSVDQKVIDREEGGRVSVEKEVEGNWLVVSQVEENDSGSYTCMVSAFHPKSVEHRVIVRSRPEVAVERDVITVVEGGQVVVGCRVVQGKPLPELTWQNGEGALVSKGSTLVLKTVDKEAGGTYYCRGDNGFSGEGSLALVELVVEHPPQLESQQLEVVHLINGTLTLFCDIGAQPPADFSWALDGVPVEGWEGDILEVEREDADQLEEIKYTCTASNKYGQANKTFLLTSKPSQPVLTSPATASLTDTTSYLLKWHVISSLPVESFQVEILGPQRFSVDKAVKAAGPEGPESRYNGQLKLETHGENLPPGIYKARVSASNLHGEGKPSGWFQISINMDQISAASSLADIHLPLLVILCLALPAPFLQ